MALITELDIELLRQSRSRARYTDFSEEERSAYQRIHAALDGLARIVVDELGGPADYVVKLTSGFHPEAGVRGYKPKDLWFGVYHRENARAFLGHPQVFMIVSERGVEYGFGPLTHPDDFSNANIKHGVRAAAAAVFRQLPSPGSTEARQLADSLAASGMWCFRWKQRLAPKQSEYRSLDAWLEFMHSDAGVQNAGGGITQYLSPEDLEAANLEAIVRQMAGIFRPLMETIRHHDVQTDNNTSRSSPQPELFADGGAGFAMAFRRFLSEFAHARTQPFQKIDSLWNAMDDLKRRIEGTSAVTSRPDLIVSVSVGQGNWASVPWIALMNARVTRSTQEGVYVVFLIAKTLDRVFLTLNQGTTKLVNELGQSGAQARMSSVAETARQQLPNLVDAGFSLDSKIDLGATGWLARNYEIGTIAHVDLDADNLPDDLTLNQLLEVILEAYDCVIDEPEPPVPEAAPPEEPGESSSSAPEPFTIDEALDELFLERFEVERLLAIWRAKKNLVLQGAPGVGKSFVAKRLAYLLVGARDAERVTTIQFHQSYSYEDFVQGYRPDGAGGFELRDGIFHRFCAKAARAPELPHVFIVDEINRGNLSKILGELMLLIEHDKRGSAWATSLTYSKPGDPPFFVPENIYILGMMNTADRSLSWVDYALRRRFSFANLEPMFESQKFGTFLTTRGVPPEIVRTVVERMTELNRAIGEDRANLGPGYRIGHSFFVPAAEIPYDHDWYRRIVETEIYPLLDEYWFDDPDRALNWRARLLDGAL